MWGIWGKIKQYSYKYFFLITATPAILILVWFIWEIYIKEAVISRDCKKEVSQTIKISHYLKQKDYDVIFNNCLMRHGSRKYKPHLRL